MPERKLSRTLFFKAENITDDSRRVTLSFSSEEPYKRYWGNEILSHAPGACDLQRLSEIGVVLFNHERDEVIGKITNCRIENNRGVAEIEFDDDDMSEMIFKKVKSGTLKGVSVGYIVDVWEEVAAGSYSADGRFAGPCSVAKRWTPFEVSIVSVPADPTVGVGRSDDDITTGLKLAERQLKINRSYVTTKTGG